MAQFFFQIATYWFIQSTKVVNWPIHGVSHTILFSEINVPAGISIPVCIFLTIKKKNYTRPALPKHFY